jgi:hypothetical protein
LRLAVPKGAGKLGVFGSSCVTLGLGRSAARKSAFAFFSQSSSDHARIVETGEKKLKSFWLFFFRKRTRIFFF